MFLSNLIPSALTLALLFQSAQTAPAPNKANINARALPPVPTPQRLTLSLAPSIPAYPMPPTTNTSSTQAEANHTLLLSNPVTPTGMYPFTNQTFLPDSEDPSTPVPFTWMKVQVRLMSGGKVVMDWARMPVDVVEWGMGFDVGKLVVPGEKEEGVEKRVGLSVVGVSPDGIQSFWGSGEVVVV
ncbi:unnamed protein product [Periconia digitata]|uniref:Uncharacterized protein n=1 Tax=Periconia digitata TaxID=1303443 RepID=A0A9W4XND1_9PLEO|nr:unnamed protein product [Periconia digitata]